MNNENIKILKLQHENKSFYRLKPDWKENSFELTFLLENSNAWHADITEEYLTKLAEERSQNVSDYYKTIKQYFINPQEDILFDVKQGGNSTAEFSIVRRIGGRTILFFNIKLNQVDFQSCIFNVIDELLQDYINLYQELGKSKEKETKLEKEKELIQAQLTEFVELKLNWEKEMYSNFIIVLNEKKKRIKFLTDLLTRKDIDPDEIDNSEELNMSTSPVASPQLQKAPETLSDSASNSEYETDKEKDDSANEIDDNEDAKPSTSKYSLEMDDDSPPTLCLPKLLKNSKQKQEVQIPKKVEKAADSTPKIFTEKISQDIPTQEMSTQDYLDRKY